MDQGTLWFALSGRVFTVQEFEAKGDGTTADAMFVAAEARMYDSSTQVA